MFIVQVVGGVGNQLFQYFFGKYLSEKYKQIVLYDIRYYNNLKTLRICELENIDPYLSVYKSKLSFFDKIYSISYKIWGLLFKLNPNNFLIRENNFVIDQVNFENSKSNFYFQGYWQRMEYIDYVKSLFFFENLVYQVESEIISFKNSIEDEENSVCIHVRRGDYFFSPSIDIYGICNSNYFSEAIKCIFNKVKNPRFFIFSDDLDWVKRNIELPNNSVFIDNFNIKQFSYIYLMSLCKHNIISNSSFSWWGAYLNRNENKTIICPSKWTLLSEDTIALDSWIKIEI
jgi:hypothetical protein